MRRNRVVMNASATGLRIIVSAVMMLVIYRYLLDQLGEQVLGVWALVFALTAAGGVGSLGLNGTLVRYVASAEGPEHREYRVELLHTAVVAGGLALLLVSCVIFAAGPTILALVVPADLVRAGTDVLPTALAAFWISAVAALYQSYCEGLQRYLLTNAILLGGTLVFAVICFIFVPHYGLAAVPVAALSQACASIVVLLAACRLLPDQIPLIPWRWNGHLFRQLLPYGARLQGMSIAAMLTDPVTKFLIGWFGGVGQAAYFDMASRLVGMTRQLLVGANTTLLPAIAGWHTSDAGRLEEAHHRDFQVVFLSASILHLGPASLAGFIAVGWLGSPVPGFIVALILLSGGWFINTISAPSYLFFLGRGELRWPLVSHSVIAILNPLLGVLCGLVAGSSGVVAGFALALSVGSMLTLVAYERVRGRHAGALLDRHARKILLIHGVAFVLCHAVFFIGLGRIGSGLLLLTGVLLYCALAWLAARNVPAMGDLRRAAAILTRRIVPVDSRAE
jgi:O-antigen/teichoic acid export membrane protein